MTQSVCMTVFTKLFAGLRDGSVIKILATQVQRPEFKSLVYTTTRWS